MSSLATDLGLCGIFFFSPPLTQLSSPNLTPFLFPPSLFPFLPPLLSHSFIHSFRYSQKLNLSRSTSTLNNFIQLCLFACVFVQLTSSVLADKWHAEARLLVARAFLHHGFVTETTTVGITGTNSMNHVVSLFIQYSAINSKTIRLSMYLIYP